MSFKRRPARKRVTGNGIAFDVADPALILALGRRPIGRTGARPEAPVTGKSVKARIEDNFTRGRIMPLDQRAGIVESTSRGTPPK
jgi:hypothetical protein